jgi:catechol 2,3-dioxygenase-like lactoylglutathione lyase family enzyme
MHIRSERRGSGQPGEQALIQVKRLGHATLCTPDLERQIAYWSEIMGLAIIDRGQDYCFLATRLGEEAIALERGSERGSLRRLSFQVKPGTDLNDVVRALGDAGIAAEKRGDISPGVREAVTFADPKGSVVEIYADYAFAADNAGDAGIAPIKFGHIAYRVNDVQKLTRFYCEVLGFRESDWISDYFSFLRCGIDHHTVNFVQYESEALHHIAFEVRDRTTLQDACDYLTKKKIQLVWGPLRHVVGHNVAAYHRNGDDIRVELFTELDLMIDEDLGYWEPRPWHEERPLRPKKWPRDTLRSQWGFGSFGTFPGYP